MALFVRESSFCNKDLCNTVINVLYSQKQTATFCDVVMKVYDCEIFAHSNVLAAASPYFSSFLGHDLPRQFSQRAPQVIEIQIDGSEPNHLYAEAVGAVIDYIYTGKMVVNEINVFQISEIARIMQMNNVIQFCDNFSTLPQSVSSPDDHPEAEVWEMLQTETCNAKVTVDAVVNTESYMTSHLDARKAGRPKSAKKLVSVSTQVIPQLLGIEPKPTVHASTQAIPSDEPLESEKTDSDCKITSMSVKNRTFPGRKRGRPRVHRSRSDENFTTKLSEKEPDIESVEYKITENLLNVYHEDVEEGRSHCEIGAVIVKTEGAYPPRRSQRTPKPTAKLRSSMQPDELADELADAADEEMMPDSKHPLTDVVNELLHSDSTNHLVEDTLVENENVGILPQEDNHVDIGSAPGTPPVLRARTARAIRRGKYVCDSCPFMTSRVGEMTQHRRQHMLAQNTCFYCDIQLVSHAELNEHLASHAGPLPFSCVACGSSFRNRTQLNLHLPKHSTVKPFMCHICGVGFKWKHALKCHALVHSQLKEHLCDVCGYATAHRSQLKAHRLIHSGQTFRCTATPDCKFQATKRQNLKYHMLTHTREKPHQCDVCGQSFSLVKNMRRHMMLHSSDKPHSCSACEFNSTRYDKLKEHMLKQHDIGSPPEKRVRITEQVMRGHTIEPTKFKIPTEVESKIIAVSPDQMGDQALEAVLFESGDDSAPQTIQIIIAPPMTAGGEVSSVTEDGVFVAHGEEGMRYEELEYTEVMLPANLVQQVTGCGNVV